MRFFKKKETKTEYDPFELIIDDPVSDFDSKPVHSTTALTSDEIINFGKNGNTPKNNSSTGALENLKQKLAAVNLEDDFETDRASVPPRDTNTETRAENLAGDTTLQLDSTVKSNAPKKPSGSSLMEKCKPYLVDKDGNEKTLNEEPLYKLQSVADILKSDSEKVLERLSANYDISVENLNPAIEEKPSDTVETATEEPTPKAAEPEKELFEDKLSFVKADQNPTKIISDIDFNGIPEPTRPDITFEPNTTVTFTPVTAGENAETGLKVSTHTKSIDLTSELINLPESINDNETASLHLEQNEFEDFVPKTEYTSKNDIRKLKRSFAVLKRRSFLTTVATFFLTALIAFAKLPFMTNLLLKHTFVTMIIFTSITAVAVLLNSDIFISFKNIFSKNSTPDVSAALASIFVLVYATAGIVKREIVIDILLILCVILSIRSLAKFFKASYLLNNFSKITVNSEKKAVKLINGPAITFAMAKNSIDGDVLIAAAQKTDNISDFMKYSTYGIFLDGKMPIITICSLVLSLISAFACASYFDAAFYGLYAATAIQLIAALPVAFLIDVLPLYRASKKLGKLGAMIMGKIGAEHLEMANAVVLSSNDLFPKGTVTLHQMKVLSENNLDDTLVRAASLTEYMGSTLAPIFKQIASTGNIDILPDTDTVKYEDQMGISGWVDNRLLFIGNRALMEAHGIEVPSLEVDRKILRQGFFPVYVATGDKACALLMIQYSVDPKIAHELRILTKIGVTLLINNTDPNLSELMICDYLGLYDESVKVMSAAGCHMYKNTVSKVKETSAPAAYRGSSLALAAIMNCATKIKRSNTILCVVYILGAVLGALLFAYTSFGGSGELLSKSALLLYSLASIIISYFLYLTERP